MKLSRTYATIALILSVFIFSACSSIEETHWENGNIKSELPYENGKLNGTARWYYEDGTIQMEVDYVSDLIEGLSIRYHNNGRKETEEIYANNLRQGKATEYSYAGKRIELKHYVNDTLHGPYRKWYSKGTELQISGEFVNGLWEGTWLYYNDYGELIGEGKYVAGNGVQRFWYPDGSLRSRTSYSNNLKHGKEYVYLHNGEEDYVVDYEYGDAIGEYGIKKL